MRVETRKLSTGKEYFSFVYWDGEKRVRLKRDECPNFDSLEKAVEWAKAKEAEIDSAKSRAMRRLQWKTQYYKFSEISEKYIEYCKKVQINSWKSTAFYLEQYVLPFFLEIKKSNNLNNWSLHFEDFKMWLEDSAYTIKSKKSVLISYSTKNHCIKTLNTFLEFCKRNNLVDPGNVYKITAFSSNKVGSRDAHSLISLEEFNAVHSHLKDKNPLVAIFFECAYWTGMRFNEIFGLSYDDLVAGEIDDSVLSVALKDNNINYYGYINLESQPAEKIRNRSEDGSIKRKPLKGKPKIDQKHNRIVPIISKELYNNLVRLYKVQEENFSKKIYGNSPKNYVLFENMTHERAVIELRLAYEKTQFKQKSYHCCRHTRCTELVGKTRDFVMARYWLGHARQETTLRYTHIYQQSANTAKRKAQRIEFLE